MAIRMNIESKQHRMDKEIAILYETMPDATNEWIKEKALALKEKADAEGIRASYVYWFLAYVFDHLSELELAFGAICEAIRLDPFHRKVHAGFEVSWDKLMAKVNLDECAPDDPIIPQIYGNLLRAGLRQYDGHMAMTRHLAHAGKLEEAMSLADTATLIYRESREGWHLTAFIAKQMGDEDLAALALEEASTKTFPWLPPMYPAPANEGVSSSGAQPPPTEP